MTYSEQVKGFFFVEKRLKVYANILCKMFGKKVAFLIFICKMINQGLDHMYTHSKKFIEWENWTGVLKNESGSVKETWVILGEKPVAPTGEIFKIFCLAMTIVIEEDERLRLHLQLLPASPEYLAG